MKDTPFALELLPRLSAGLARDALAAPLPGAVWFTAGEAGDGFTYGIVPGVLPRINWFTCDLLTDQNTDLVLNLEFYEPDNLQPFMCRFTLLPKTQARLRFDTKAFDFNRWRYHREGGCLKPTIGGWHVDPALVNRIVLKVLYKAPGPAHWCMTPLQWTNHEPAILIDPILLEAPLIDELGQATFRDWPGKTRSDSDLRADLSQLLVDAPNQRGPACYSCYGGWMNRRVEGIGFFRTHHDGDRWWLVEPDGYLFWSVGPDRVTPSVDTNIKYLHRALAWLPPRTSEFAESFGPVDPTGLSENEPFDFCIANLIRAFGDQWHKRWQQIAYPLIRGLGFNTCGNWSDCASASAAEMPYVFPIPALAENRWQVGRIFRDFPDVFDQAFEIEAEVYAQSLIPLSDDPAQIGYFLMNEPMWGFARMLLAEGMMRNTATCATRRIFAEQLRDKYRTEDALNMAWGNDVSFREIAEALWTKSFTNEALEDLKAFSTVMVRRLYGTLSAACRRADPNHLNLGARFSSAPEDWIVDAMGDFDVFSINCYQIAADERLASVCAKLKVPALIGEWHFGALDAGLPAPGIGHCADQKGRGQAYRYFVENSAAQPWCVGAHWFTLYDQSALGRSDGENYNIGFIDICHRVYQELADAARLTHERLYEVASGKLSPFPYPPEIVDRLNM